MGNNLHQNTTNISFPSALTLYNVALILIYPVTWIILMPLFYGKILFPIEINAATWVLWSVQCTVGSASTSTGRCIRSTQEREFNQKPFFSAISHEQIFCSLAAVLLTLLPLRLITFWYCFLFAIYFYWWKNKYAMASSYHWARLKIHKTPIYIWGRCTNLWLDLWYLKQILKPINRDVQLKGCTNIHGRPYWATPHIFIQPLGCIFLYLLGLKSVWDIVSLNQTFVHLLALVNITANSQLFLDYFRQRNN